jgi:hypothetical protein
MPQWVPVMGTACRGLRTGWCLGWANDEFEIMERVAVVEKWRFRLW